MLLATLSPLLLSTIFLPTTTLAAPTRIHCRCTILSSTSSDSDTPSHPATHNICTDLGPRLESLQHLDPDLYAAHTHHPISPPNDETQHALSSTHDSDREPRPTARPQQRLVCRAEPEPFSSYQNSFVNLWALQIIVAVSILACVAEGVHLVVRWFNRRAENDPAFPAKPTIHLLGAEQRLQVLPSSGAHMDSVPSPGAEKKIRSYRTLQFFRAREAGGRREFSAYEEDEDDEVNRPVM